MGSTTRNNKSRTLFMGISLIMYTVSLYISIDRHSHTWSARYKYESGTSGPRHPCLASNRLCYDFATMNTKMTGPMSPMTHASLFLLIADIGISILLDFKFYICHNMRVESQTMYKYFGMDKWGIISHNITSYSIYYVYASNVYVNVWLIPHSRYPCIWRTTLMSCVGYIHNKYDNYDLSNNACVNMFRLTNVCMESYDVIYMFLLRYNLYFTVHNGDFHSWEVAPSTGFGHTDRRATGPLIAHQQRANTYSYATFASESRPSRRPSIFRCRVAYTATSYVFSITVSQANLVRNCACHVWHGREFAMTLYYDIQHEKCAIYIYTSHANMMRACARHIWNSRDIYMILCGSIQHEECTIDMTNTVVHHASIYRVLVYDYRHSREINMALNYVIQHVKCVYYVYRSLRPREYFGGCCEEVIRSITPSFAVLTMYNSMNAYECFIYRFSIKCYKWIILGVSNVRDTTLALVQDIAIQFCFYDKIITCTLSRSVVYQVSIYMEHYVGDVQLNIKIYTVLDLYYNMSPYQSVYQTLFFLFHMRRLYGSGLRAVHGVNGDPLVSETRRGALTSFHRYRSTTTTLVLLIHNEWTWTFSFSVASPALEGLHSLDALPFFYWQKKYFISNLKYFHDIMTVAELLKRQIICVLRCCGCVLCLSLDWAIFSAKVPISHTSTGRTVQGTILCESVAVCIWDDVPYHLEFCIHLVCIFNSEDASRVNVNFLQYIYMNVYDLYLLLSILVYE